MIITDAAVTDCRWESGWKPEFSGAHGRLRWSTAWREMHVMYGTGYYSRITMVLVHTRFISASRITTPKHILLRADSQ